MRSLIGITPLLVACLAGSAGGQALTDRILAVREGTVRLSYGVREGICGDGETFIRDRSRVRDDAARPVEAIGEALLVVPVDRIARDPEPGVDLVHPRADPDEQAENRNAECGEPPEGGPQGGDDLTIDLLVIADRRQPDVSGGDVGTLPRGKW